MLTRRSRSPLETGLDPAGRKRTEIYACLSRVLRVKLQLGIAYFVLGKNGIPCIRTGIHWLRFVKKWEWGQDVSNIATRTVVFGNRTLPPYYPVYYIFFAIYCHKFWGGGGAFFSGPQTSSLSQGSTCIIWAE